MLSLETLTNTDDKRKILQNLDPQKDCLIVADLRSKFEWQNYYLDRYGILEEEFIFRPSDLWSLLGRVLHPEIRWVSKDLIQSYMSQFLKKKDEDFFHSPRASATAFGYVSQLAPLFQQENGRELLKEWFKENIEAFYRWGHWFFAAEELWEECKSQKMLCNQWIPAFLSSSLEGVDKLWNRNFVLDLGLEIKYIEAELFASLGSYYNFDVRVILPLVESSSNYSAEYESYRPLMGKMKECTAYESLFQNNKSQKVLRHIDSWGGVKRYASSLSEVKDVVAEIRKLCDQGVDPQNIAILSADIGASWPILRYYLDQEGIPCQRPYNSGVQSFKSIYQWLSDIQIRIQQWDTADLELSLFSAKEKVLTKEQFQRFFFHVYGNEDLQRVPELATKFQGGTKGGGDEISRDEFLVWILSLWPSEQVSSSLEQMIKNFFMEVKASFSLPPADWVHYLAQVCSKMEVNLRPGSQEGIACVDLSSAEYLPCKYLFFLSLSDSSLRRQSQLKAVSARDILSLRDFTGFPFSPEENRSFEFYIDWICGRNLEKLYFSFAATDWEGRACAPSLLWMEAKRQIGEEAGELSLPQNTRLDEIQLLPLDELPNFKQSQKDIGSVVRRDLGEEEILSPFVCQKFSPSALREFLLCPFRYKAKYSFSLSSLPALDLDIDRMKAGNIFHRLFELAIQEKLKKEETEKISNLVERVIAENQGEIGEERLWASLKKSYQDLLVRFLAFEEAWIVEFPKTEYFLQEHFVDLHYNRNTRKFEDTDALPRFRAVIDRVDRNEKQAIVIDYKSSKGNYKNYNSWLKEEDFQLLLYTKLIEDACVPGVEEVVSSVYYSIKPWQRSTGFVRKDCDPEFSDANSRKRNAVAKSELVAMQEEMEEIIEKYFSQLEEGKLSPQPKKPEETCTQCDWKSLCRAPHLNF